MKDESGEIYSSRNHDIFSLHIEKQIDNHNWNLSNPFLRDYHRHDQIIIICCR